MVKTTHGKVRGKSIELQEDLGLRDGEEVEVEVRTLAENVAAPSLEAVYAILSKRFDSGEHDVAARHDEHQP